MIIAVEDKSYRCKDCDSFSQCKYYHHRRPDSHICKEFRNDWRQRDVLDKISAEIKELDEGITSYHNDKPWLYKSEVLEIVEKYKGGSK
jgi:hypothetical protein